MSKIIDHTHPLYRRIWQTSKAGVRFNGAFFYSVELTKNIIPNVETKRNWVTVNLHGYCMDNSIVFIHNNKRPENYRWLRRYKNLVLVCGIEETMEKVKEYGDHVIYCPLTIDVDEVKRFAKPKTKKIAYVGRKAKARGCYLPEEVEFLSNLPRPRLLAKMAEYEQVYAVGRCAIEAKALGCEVLPFDPRYPDPSIWKVLDNKEAAKMLQKQLDALDHPHIIDTTNPKYKLLRAGQKSGQHNGAYYYSKEISKNIIPFVKTSRPWDTLGMRMVGSLDHAIVFIHHGINHDKVYYWLDRYKDQILVCSTKETYDWAISKGKKAIFLPLSIDVDYVKQFKTKKIKKACYSGNRWKFKEADTQKYVPDNVDFPPPNLPREDLLKFIAQYEECYAIGRCALEAKVLGCKIKVCYHKYPDPNYWKVLDNADAAKILQERLDEIDG